MVVIKLAAVLFVIGVGAFYINPTNWHPFAPTAGPGSASSATTSPGRPTPAATPVGMLAGAAIIFFAYIGFDSVSTHTEEAKNPQRDVPIGIIASLLICTVLYVAVVAVLTGMVKYDQHRRRRAGVATPSSSKGIGWAEVIIADRRRGGHHLGAAGDDALAARACSWRWPATAWFRKGFFGDVHPKFRTPWKIHDPDRRLRRACWPGFLPHRLRCCT